MQTVYARFPKIGNSSDDKPEKKNILLRPIILICAAAVLVIFFAVFLILASRIWDPFWSPFRPSPEKVLSSSFLKMKDVKELGYKINLDVDFNNNNLKDGKSSLGIKSQGATSVDKNYMKADISIVKPDSGNFSAALESRVVGNKSYYKISSLNFSKDMLDFEESAFLDRIKDRWIDTGAASESLAKEDNLAGPQAGKNAIMERIKSIFLENKNNIYFVKSQFEDDKLSGNLAYHYKLSLNNQALKDSAIEIISSAISQEKDNVMGLMAINAIKGTVSSFLDEAGDIDIDIWIGKKDFYVYRLLLQKGIDLSKMSSSESGTIIVKLDVNYSDFNSSVKVYEPENPQILETLILPLQEAISASAKNIKIKNAMNQIKFLALEINKNKKSFASVSCKDKDIKLFCDDIEANIGTKGLDPVFFSSKDKFCAYVPLAMASTDSRARQYFCIDSANNSLITATPDKCNSETLSCPLQ